MKRRDFIKKGLIGVPVGMQWLLLGTACSTARLDDRSPAADDKVWDPSSRKYVPRPQAAPDAISRAAVAPIRTRLDATKATTDLAIYAAAVIKMRSFDKSDGRSWVAQATVHNSHCPHGGWEFFPWHRDYLSRFENIIRSLDPAWANFNLPYWDWAGNGGKLPPAFLDKNSSLSKAEQGNFPKPGLKIPAAVDGSRSADLSAQITGVASASIINGILAAKDFTSFIGADGTSGEIEGGPHNGVHGVIGGSGGPMGAFMSPLDPIFWVHHCNVDRLWAVWQEQNPDMKDSAKITTAGFGAWLALTHKGFYNLQGKPIEDAKGKLIAGQIQRTASQMLDTKALGYQYSTPASGQLADEIWSPISRSPAAETRPWILDNRTSSAGGAIPSVFSEKSKTFATLEFPDLKKSIQYYADLYMANREAKVTVNGREVVIANLIFRLIVKDCPRLPNATVMKVSLAQPAMFLMNINSFKDDSGTNEHQAMHEKQHGATTNLAFDFTRVLEALSSAGYKSYPADSLFNLEFSRQGRHYDANNVLALNEEFDLSAYKSFFDQMKFNIIVDEKVYR